MSPRATELSAIAIILFLAGLHYWLLVNIHRQIQITDTKVELCLLQVNRMVQEFCEIEEEESVPDKTIEDFLSPITVQVSAYNPTKKQCGSNPLITASNQRVHNGIIALSRDLEEEFELKFGDRIILEGLGEFEFQDRMHPKWERKVDIFMWNKKEAIEFGVQEAIAVFARKLEYGGL